MAHLKLVIEMISEVKLFKKGVVDTYFFPEPYLRPLLVHVFNNRSNLKEEIEIQNKGMISCALSLFFKQNIPFKNDLVSKKEEKLEGLGLKDLDSKRVIVTQKVISIPIVCVVRGYFTQSFGTAFEKGKSWTQGLSIEEDVQVNDKLNIPIFNLKTNGTSCSKEQAIKYLSLYLKEREIKDISPEDLYFMMRKSSILIYKEVSSFSERKDLIVLDTRLEFGLEKNTEGNFELVWKGEGITPTTTRFYDKINRRILNEDPIKKSKNIDESVIEEVIHNYKTVFERLFA